MNYVRYLPAIEFLRGGNLVDPKAYESVIPNYVIPAKAGTQSVSISLLFLYNC